MISPEIIANCVMSNAHMADVVDHRLVADVASELGERLTLETGGSASVECKCEAVGGDSENRYLECTYEVREGGSLVTTGHNLATPGDNMSESDKNKVNVLQKSTATTPVAMELLRKKQQQNKRQQGVVAVKVP